MENTLRTILTLSLLIAASSQATWGQAVPVEGHEKELPDFDAAKVIFKVDYESGTLDSGVPGVAAVRPQADDSILISTDIVRSGKYAVRHRVGYSPKYRSRNALRAESSNMHTDGPVRYGEGDYHQYRYSYYVPKDSYGNRVGIVWQFKRFMGRPDQIIVLGGEFPRDTWVDVLYRIKWGHTREKGWIKNYQKLASEKEYKLRSIRVGRNTLDARARYTYLKWGIYKPIFPKDAPETSRRTIYHDDISVAVFKPTAEELGLETLTAEEQAERDRLVAEAEEIKKAGHGDRMRRQFIEYYAGEADNAEAAKEYLATLRPDGTWPDIDFSTCRRWYDWEPGPRSDPGMITHLDRVLSLAVAYGADPKSPYHKDPKVKAAILTSLGYWLKRDPEYINMYFMMVKMPYRVAGTLLLLGDDAPDGVVQRAHDSVLRSVATNIRGADNRDTGLIVLMRDLLQDDFLLMRSACEAVWERLAVTDFGEAGRNTGIMPDWSFHSWRGPHLQYGTHGLTLMSPVFRCAATLHGTPYGASEEKLSILRNYLLEGAAWTVWKDYMDLSACGWEIDSGCQREYGQAIVRQLRGMAHADPAHRERYETCLKDDLVGHKAFWLSDVSVHRQPTWYASVRMSSKRNLGGMSRGGNLQGLHQGSGVLMVHLTGGEYADIQPLWDWRRLPGTTTDQGIQGEGLLAGRNNFGASDFAGGLGGGSAGVAAMIYGRGALAARKAWFFERDAVICLGAGIAGKSSGEVVTSVQQSLLEGEVVTAEGNVKVGTHALKPGSWVHHAGFAYQVRGLPAKLQLGPVEGNWQTVVAKAHRADRPASGNIFSLWIDHGASPEAQTYAYTIYPQTWPSETEADIKEHQTRILSNTAQLQATEGAEGVHAVFYEPGQLKLANGDTIAVDAPCLLSLRGNKLLVADPTHKLEKLSVTLAGKKIPVILPKGAGAGRQVAVDL